MSIPAAPLVFPVKNSAFSVPCQFYKNDGTLITGWSSPTVTCITIDGAVWVHTYPLPVESNSNGDGWIDIPAAGMNGKLVNVIATVGNSGALPFVANIVTDGLQEISGALSLSISASVWSALDGGATIGRQNSKGAMFDQIYRYLFNYQKVDKLAQTQTLFADDSATPMVTGMISANSQVTVKGKMA